jgi:hypothetical protein
MIYFRASAEEWWMTDMDAGRRDHEPWAIRLAGDEATRKAGDNLRQWADDSRTPVRRFLDRVVTFREERDPKLSGAWGEEIVAKELAKLGPAWTVLHGVRIGPKADVDHLVIGPGGVFSLNTKHLGFEAKVTVTARQFRVNGYSRDYYPKAVKEAERVAERLSRSSTDAISVRPVIVVAGMNKANFHVREQPKDVSVVTRRGLRGWLTSRTVVLVAEEVESLARIARTPSTWDPSKIHGVIDRTPPPPAPDVTVTRWRRYGHDRSYVNDAQTGKRLGWRDERTGELHVEPGADADRVRSALEAPS